MTYRRDNNSILDWTLAGLCIVLVLVLVFLTTLPRSLSNGLHRLGQTMWYAREVATEQTTFNARLLTMSKASLVEELKNYEQQLAAYKARVWENHLLRQENQELAAMVRYVDEHNFSHTARVISRPPQSLYDRLILDQGEEQGVRPGQFVYAGESVVLGRVESVSVATATVQLYSTPGIESRVRFIATDLVATAVGQGNGSFVVELPQSIEIEQGAQVAHVATGDLLGVVGEVVTDPREPFQQVYVRSPIGMRYLDWVHLR